MAASTLVLSLSAGHWMRQGLKAQLGRKGPARLGGLPDGRFAVLSRRLALEDGNRVTYLQNILVQDLVKMDGGTIQEIKNLPFYQCCL